MSYSKMLGEFFGEALITAAEAIAADDKSRKARALARETAESIIRRGYGTCTVTIDGQTYTANNTTVTIPVNNKVPGPYNSTECDFTFLNLYKYARAINKGKVETKVGDKWSFHLNGANASIIIRYGRTPIAGVQFLDKDKDEIIGAFYSDKYDKIEKVRVFKPDLIGYPDNGMPIVISAGERMDQISWNSVVGAHGDEVLQVINKMMDHVYRK